MANAKRQSSAPGEAKRPDPLERIANLLALLLVKNEGETGKAVTLAAAGFSPAEIGGLLGKQPNTVSVLLYNARKQATNAAKKSTRSNNTRR